MAEDKNFEKFLGDAAAKMTAEIDRQVAMRTHKLRATRDSLRAELETTRAELQGKTEEFKGQVQRARDSEEKCAFLKKVRAEQAVTLQALQEKLTKLAPPEPDISPAPDLTNAAPGPAKAAHA